MGRRRIHPKKLKTPKAPRAKMEGVNVKILQDALWTGQEYPEYFNSYRMSAELIKIFKILVNKPTYWHDGLIFNVTDPVEKLHVVFGTDYRHIFTYIAVEDFTLTCGEIVEKLEAIPANYAPSKLRRIYKDDLILIRVDKRDEDLKMDLQVLTSGLFQDTSDDFRNFKLDSSDLVYFRKYLKLVDNDGVKEKFL